MPQPTLASIFFVINVRSFIFVIDKCQNVFRIDKFPKKNNNNNQQMKQMSVILHWTFICVCVTIACGFYANKLFNLNTVICVGVRWQMQQKHIYANYSNSLRIKVARMPISSSTCVTFDVFWLRFALISSSSSLMIMTWNRIYCKMLPHPQKRNSKINVSSALKVICLSDSMSLKESAFSLIMPQINESHSE